ncbi:MAG: hypothetical protein LOY01_08320, partial [Brachybacterium paraconglomeratum]|nr:hypothetical protein [Brachybacterium paraconglomeratum]
MQCWPSRYPPRCGSRRSWTRCAARGGVVAVVLACGAAPPGLAAQAGPAPFTSAVYVVGAPYVLVPLGAVLVAAGLGAAGARRLG